MTNAIQANLMRTRKRMAHAVGRHHDAETVRQERQRAGEARGAMMRYREALHMADLAAEWEAV